MPFIIFLIAIVVIVLWMVSLYNRLVSLRNRRQNAFADIDVQLRQRHDLVPQLVETVRGYASHERGVLTQVTEARSAAISAKTIDDKIVASRRFFNGATTEYNNAVETFPSNLIANNFGFKREIMFDLGTEGRTRMEEPPSIKF